MNDRYKKFVPLGIIFTVILLLTFGTPEISDTPREYMRLFMGFFFLVFGFFKALKWKKFVEAYRMYDIVAKKSTAYAYAYPLIELGLGAFYLFNSTHLFWTNIITLVVMSVGSIGVWQKLREKEEIPCACLGTVFKIPMTKVTLFEDLLMVGMALLMLVSDVYVI